MKVVVGGTGLIGKKVARILRGPGPDVALDKVDFEDLARGLFKARGIRREIVPEVSGFIFPDHAG